MTSYAFDEVRSALHEHWGLSLYRGGDLTDLGRDGRWDTTYSKTGYIVGGHLPGRGHGYRRFRTLTGVVRACDLTKVLSGGLVQEVLSGGLVQEVVARQRRG